MTRRAATPDVHDGDDAVDATGAAAAGAQRVDKWLWYVRLVKSRTQASGLVEAGKVRINRKRVVKPSATVATGDIVTVAAHEQVRILRVLAPGTRRGPAAEAKLLFEDLTPPPVPAKSAEARSLDALGGARDAGSGRPTKRERRQIERLRGRDGEA